MLYQIDVGLYEGKRVSRYCTDLSLPNLDQEYWKSKKIRTTDYLQLLQYNYYLKKWEFVTSLLNY